MAGADSHQLHHETDVPPDGQAPTTESPGTVPVPTSRLHSVLLAVTGTLRRRPTIAATIGLACVVALLFSDLVFRGRVLFDRDINLFWFTQVESLVHVVTRPAWPLWDPFTSFGQPLLADPSGQVLYPFTWLNLLLPAWTYYSLFVVLHLTLSGLGAYRLGRAWGFSSAAAFTSGALWCASGPLLSLVNVTPHFTGACWMPWLVLATQWAAEHRRVRDAVLWGVLAALQINAGSADMCAMTVLCSAVVLAAHVKRPLAANVRLAGVVALAVVLATALSALQWLPALDVALRSMRRGLPEQIRTYWSLHPLGLVELVWPLSWRNVPLGPVMRGLLSEGRDPFLHSIYLGLATVVLACASLASRRRRLALALGGTALVALLVALGRHAPFYEWLVLVFPPLRILRYPQKALVVVALGGALLAGLGMEALLRCERRGRAWRLAVVLPAGILAAVTWSALAALHVWSAPLGGWLLRGLPARIDRSLFLPTQNALWAAGVVITLALALMTIGPRLRLPAAAVAWGLALLAVFDLIRVHHTLHPTTVPALYTYRPQALAVLPRGDGSRLYAYDYLYSPGPSVASGPRPSLVLESPPPSLSFRERAVLAFRESLAPPVAGAWGRESSFDADYRGLYSRELADLVAFLRESELTPAHRRLLRLGAVSHVVALHDRGFEDLELVTKLGGVLRNPVRVFRVPGALPRTYAVAGARIAGGEAALKTLVDAGFDPTREIVLPRGPSVGAPPGFSGSSRLLALRPDSVRLEAQLSAPGFVVLVDTYDPGWHVTVDGRPALLLRANVAFRAVAVPAGSHEVVFTYRPRSVLWGAALSLAALLGLAAFGLVAAVRRPPPQAG